MVPELKVNVVVFCFQNHSKFLLYITTKQSNYILYIIKQCVNNSSRLQGPFCKLKLQQYLNHSQLKLCTKRERRGGGGGEKERERERERGRNPTPYKQTKQQTKTTKKSKQTNARLKALKLILLSPPYTHTHTHTHTWGHTASISAAG